MSHLLIAEDEHRIAAFLEKGLRSHGFTVTLATNAQQTLNLAAAGSFDLLILDLGLPDGDGLEVLATIRGQGNPLPVIILSARDDLDDKVSGLEGGADDYVTKPFRFEELLARVRARLRPAPSHHPNSDQMLTVGALQLDVSRRIIAVAGEWMDLPGREFALAEVLMRHPDQVLSRAQLLDHVWGYDYDPGSNIVDVYVGYLRKKLGAEAIETVRGVGYRLRSQQLSTIG